MILQRVWHRNNVWHWKSLSEVLGTARTRRTIATTLWMGYRMFFCNKASLPIRFQKNAATLQWRSKSSLRPAFPRFLVLKVFRIIWPTQNRCVFFWMGCQQIQQLAVEPPNWKAGSSSPSFDVTINTLKAPHTNTKYQQFLKISNFFFHFLKPVWKHLANVTRSSWIAGTNHGAVPWSLFHDCTVCTCVEFRDNLFASTYLPFSMQSSLPHTNVCIYISNI